MELERFSCNKSGRCCWKASLRGGCGGLKLDTNWSPTVKRTVWLVKIGSEVFEHLTAHDSFRNINH